jgi:hypothetical protein
MATKNSSKDNQIIVPPPDFRRITVTLEGTTPLITHPFSEKARREMLATQQKTKLTAKDIRNPIRDFIESLYWLTPMPTEFTEEAFEKAVAEGARFGFPSIAFKLAATSAGYRAKLTKDKVSILGAFRIEGEFVEIEGTPIIREDMVRLQGGTADLRFRGEFKNWKVTLKITYNAGAISDKELVNLLMYGGFACGVGEWRVEKGGQFGMYTVV